MNESVVNVKRRVTSEPRMKRSSDYGSGGSGTTPITSRRTWYLAYLIATSLLALRA